jgi:peptide/nickel transport system substrate-binding protein
VRLNRFLLALVGICLAVGTAFWASGARRDAPAGADAGPVPGGRLLATSRSEPKTFNRYVSASTAEELVTRLTQATLVRVNRVTGGLEPRLAQDWTTSPDGLVWTLRLRPGVTFSDGAPFSSADVVFSFTVVNDPRINSAMASGLRVGDKPLAIRAPDDHTVVVTFPAPFGPGLALLDGLPILPRHKLEAAYKAGEFAKAWSVTTPMSDMAGLGPFVIKEYVAGQRLVFERNTRFWGRDEQGRALPYLDAIELQIVPEQNGEMLRLQSGAVDLVTDQVRAEDIATLRPLADRGALRLTAAGVSISPDMFWINLTPGAAAARTRPWLQREELRRAISYAVNRQSIVDTVYLGAAEPIFGPITPGGGQWFLPDLPRTDYDPAKAAALLASIGLKDRNGDGLLDDTAGKTARVTVLTAKGRTVTERTGAMIQEQVRKVGLTLDVVPVDLGSMIEAWNNGDYDAILFRITADSTDPARNSEYWMSSGSFHVWNPAQRAPATDWEAAIDDRFRRQATTLDIAERKRLFAEAQRILAEHLPVIYFAAPRVTVASSARVRGVAAAVVPPTILWNAEMLSIDRAPIRR